MAILMQTPKAAGEPMMKLLKSAVANAENNHSMDVEKLYVSQVFATPGPIPQAHHAPGPGPCLSYQQAYLSRHPGCGGESIRRETVYGTEG